MEPTQTTGLSARARRQDDLAVFAIGLAVSVGVGVLISFIWNLAIIDATGLALGVYGGVLLATGGASGGGYRKMTDESGERWNTRPRNEVSPKALRQVATGSAYLAIGIGVSFLFG
jgi:hypothetical protein